MSTSFPTSKDSFNNLTPGVSKMNVAPATASTIINQLQDGAAALQTKVGIDSSADTTSIDYKLKNTASSNPGHKHTLAQGATDVTATAAEVNYNAGAGVGSSVASKTVVLDASKNYNMGTGSLTATGITATGTSTGAIGSFTTLNAPLPQGYLIDGRISVTVATNNLTVAIKTLTGNDPSATEPVYIRINNNIRSITAALSVTMAAATNWFNSGGTELAASEADYFVYLSYRTASTAVVIGVSRIPCGRIYSDFSATTTNETHLEMSTAPASGDDVEVIGRFAATLSAGAGYTWTVPTFTTSNLIQRPIFNTRRLSYTPARAVAAGTVPTYTAADVNYYELRDDIIIVNTWWQNTAGGTAGAGAGTLTSSLPFNTKDLDGSCAINGYSFESAGTIIALQARVNGSNTNSIKFTNCAGALTDLTGADQSSTSRQISFAGMYFLNF